MRPFERRSGRAYPYFKLAVWDERAFTWRDGKRAFASEAEANRQAPKGAKCRISRVDEAGRTDLEPFQN